MWFSIYFSFLYVYSFFVRLFYCIIIHLRVFVNCVPKEFNFLLKLLLFALVFSIFSSLDSEISLLLFWSLLKKFYTTLIFGENFKTLRNFFLRHFMSIPAQLKHKKSFISVLYQSDLGKQDFIAISLEPDSS